MKDYYDIYLIYTKDWENINKCHLKNAMKTTFQKREYQGDMLYTLNIIRNSKILKERWLAYSKQYKFANNIDYETVIKYLEIIINKCYLDTNWKFLAFLPLFFNIIISYKKLTSKLPKIW